VGGTDVMIDRLQNFLRACDRTGHLDLAGQALVLAIAHLAGPTGEIPPILAREYARGVNAIRLIRSGGVPARADLRALAELEHLLESPGDGGVGASNLERETLRSVLASMTGSLPHNMQVNLARGSSNEDTDEVDNNSTKGFTLAGWYTITAVTSFATVAGLSALPSAITFGGNAWVTALVPLACVALLIWIIYQRV
jgi:hypothetical protein